VTKLAVIGKGKMGTLVAALGPEASFEVVAHLGRKDAANGISAAALNGAKVAIEFTVPGEAAGVVRGCAALGVPVVSGTTGWDVERPAVEDAVRASKGALLWAPNFALGVHLFVRVVADAVRFFADERTGFSVQIVETHHAQKLDAPSGTAKMLAAVAEKAAGRPVPVTSVRTGHVPGTHEFIFEAPFEQVRLVHEARDRKVFAAGAVAAARWLVGRQGVFTLDDFFSSGETT
jgi:4-hydroxy-tetrahydrodipicolinate reductase